MTKLGRDFELLVSAIEQALVPKGVEVKSPESVFGRHSKTHRDVDVSLRVKDGEVESFVMIECRDRVGHQGLDWIEQVVTKREDVGADLAVVVSSGGFTSGAKTSAESHGVLLHQVDDLDMSLLEKLFTLIHLGVFQHVWNCKYLAFHAKDHAELRVGVGTPDDGQERFGIDSDAVCLALSKTEQPTVTVTQLIDKIVWQADIFPDPNEFMPKPDEESDREFPYQATPNVLHRIRASIPEGMGLWLAVPGREQPIQTLDLILETHVVVHEIPIRAVKRYATTGQTAGLAAVATGQVGDLLLDFKVTKRPATENELLTIGMSRVD